MLWLMLTGHGVVVAFIYGVDVAAVRFRLARMRTVQVKCAHCSKEFERKIGQYKEALKFGWRQYCSFECRDKDKILAKISVCDNPKCKNKIVRIPSQTKKSRSGKSFCSHSCAAIVTNEARIKYNTCADCGKPARSYNKFCSFECSVEKRRKPREQMRSDTISRIKMFHKAHKRIPVKREVYGLYKTARLVFGSWNKAVEAAGFNPNPVLFANKVIANDGHSCDSFTEKVIDDWLSENNIPHERNYPYGAHRFTADFKVGPNILIEFFGLAGVQKNYDQIIIRKRAESEKRGFELIELYPKDIYPKNKLPDLLKILL